ncbi:MAG: zinc-binding alcohol dehydrogenase [Anaerolineaceae bacterium]
MKRNSLVYISPGNLKINVETVDPPREGEIQVRTRLSAISPGTEMLVYRGQIPEEMAIDSTVPTFTHPFQYPVKYGYTCSGEVIKIGPGVSESWLGQRVFSFNPHESLFTTSASNLVRIPEYISDEDSIFLPNMETAVNFLQDSKPLIGEVAFVVGTGIVGLLTTSLLARIPLKALMSVDRFPKRREEAIKAGAMKVFDPAQENAAAEMIKACNFMGIQDKADLVIECSGNPEGLNLAIQLAGFSGRVIIGSWYGTKTASLDLGGDFHRSRIQLKSSQVSTIDPSLCGRWNKARRFELAWQMIDLVKPSRWITHHFEICDFEKAFHLLDKNPEESIQVVFNYK